MTDLVESGRDGLGPGELTRMRVCVTVKAYPQMSALRGEVVCVAGLRVETFERPAWVRLFPVPFRDLEWERRFRKWDVIEVDVRRPQNDPRPESWEPDPDSIEVVDHLPTDDRWRRRRDAIGDVDTITMCGLRKLQAESDISLGIVKPAEVVDFDWEPIPGDEQRAAQEELKVPGLVAPDRQPLEVIPWRFYYRYRCADPECRTHHQSIIDWEIHQAYRRWLRDYGPDEVFARLREKWLDQLCAPDRDTRFFIGNMRRYPRNFLVLGVYWPPRLELDDAEPRELFG